MLTISETFIATENLRLMVDEELQTIFADHGYDNLTHYYYDDHHSFVDEEGNQQVGEFPWVLGEDLLKYCSRYYLDLLKDYATSLEAQFSQEALREYSPSEQASFPSQKEAARKFVDEGVASPILTLAAEIKEIEVEVLARAIIEKAQELEMMAVSNGNWRRFVIAKASSEALDEKLFTAYKAILKDKLKLFAR